MDQTLKTLDDGAREVTVGRRSRRWLAPAMVAVAYAASLRALPLDGFWVCDNGAKFIQLQGIVRGGYRDFAIAWPGQPLDPTFAFNPLPAPFGHVVEGRLFCQYSPVFALISSVPYRLLGIAGLYLLPLAGGLLTLVAAWRLAGLLPAARLGQPLAVLITGLATPIWFYSLTFWEHTPAAGLWLWSVYHCVRACRSNSQRDLGLGALNCGLAIWMRDELYVGALVLIVYTASVRCSQRRAPVLFMGVLLATLLPLWAFQMLVLGTPLGYHFAEGTRQWSGLITHLAERGAVFRNLLLRAHQTEWLSNALCAPFITFWILRPRLPARCIVPSAGALAVFAAAVGLIVLTGMSTADAPLSYVAGANGLFGVAPVLLLAFVSEKVPANHGSVATPAVSVATAREQVWLLVTAHTFLHVLIVPLPNTLGTHWGCRFLLPMYPLLAVLAAGTVSRWWELARGRSRRLAVVMVVAVGVSGALQTYALRLLQARMKFWAEFSHAVATRPEKVIVTDSWPVPMELAQCFFDKWIFLAPKRAAPEELLEALRAGGEKRALFIGPYDGPDVGPPARIMDDGFLHFARYLIQPLDLAGRAPMQAVPPSDNP